MRIVQVIHSLRRGGAERICIQLASALARLGHSSSILSLYRKNEYNEILYKSNVNWFSISSGGEFDYKWDFLRLVVATRRIIKRIQPDVIHLHLPSTAPVVYFATGQEFITTLHSSEVFYSREKSLKRKLLSLLVKHSSKSRRSKLVAVSQDVAIAYKQGYRLTAEPRVIHNGVDTKMFHPETNPKTGRENAPLKIIMVGTLSEGKNHQMAFRALRYLKERNNGVHLTLVGSGPCESQLLSLGKDLGVESEINFAGTRTDVPQLLASSDLMWHTSRTEGLCMVLLEAMATKIPVIASDVPGVRQLCTDGLNSLLVPLDSHEELARKTMLLADNKGLKIFLAENAYSMVIKKYTTEHMVKNYIELYRTMAPAGS